MIRFGKESDFSSIKTLWQACFGDDIDYIENFLQEIFKPDNCLIYEEEGEVLSFLFILNAELKAGERVLSAGYIYAACTREDRRRQGHMSALMAKSREHARELNLDLLFLVPAKKELFNYYEKFGFKKAFKRKEFILDREIMTILADSESSQGEFDLEKLHDIRRATLLKQAGIIWPKDIFSYSFSENELAGGENIYASLKGQLVGCAQAYSKDDKCYIKEFCAQSKGPGALIKQILDRFTLAESFEFSLAMDFPFSCDDFVIIENAMALPLTDEAKNRLDENKNAYMGLTLG